MLCKEEGEGHCGERLKSACEGIKGAQRVKSGRGTVKTEQLVANPFVWRRLTHDAPDISRRIGTCLVVHHQVVQSAYLPPDSPGHTPAHRPPATRCAVTRSCIGICHPGHRDTRPRIGTLPRGASSPGRASAPATRPTGTRGRASAPATRFCNVNSITCGHCVIAATRSGHLARLLPRTLSSPSRSFPVRTHRRRRHHRASRSFERAFPLYTEKPFTVPHGCESRLPSLPHNDAQNPKITFTRCKLLGRYASTREFLSC
ncbi:unnamed protein product [Trichogramma brassicae]|uniref:Uncharacterized protein n=1 Tax=Trichogramma brassicae TaxID=86971 RepID=A0A6H5J563_9HYME|nr:unnamed protein product [Trichogramma brassicae]